MQKLNIENKVVKRKWKTKIIKNIEENHDNVTLKKTLLNAFNYKNKSMKENAAKVVNIIKE